MRHKLKFSTFFYTILFSFFIFTSCYTEAFAHETIQKHILIINSYDKCVKRSEDLLNTLLPILKSSNESLDISTEYMDTKSFNDKEYIKNLCEFYKQKFSNKKFDLIVSIDDDAINFLKEYSKSLFPNTPIVFSGVNSFDKSILKDNPVFTGIVETTPVKDTIDVALSLNKNIKNIIVLNDNSSTGLSMKKLLDTVIPIYKGKVNFTFLDDTRLLHDKKITNNSVVLLLCGFTTNYNKSIFINSDTILSQDDLNIPIYSVFDTLVGHGVLGGKMISTKQEAETLGALSLRILRGENPKDIPIITTSDGKYIFDYNLITKFDIPTTSLPYKSSLINLKPLFYTVPKAFVLLFIVFIITLSIFLTMTLYEKYKTRDALIESEKRLRTLINAFPDFICLKDGYGHWVEVNTATINFLNLKDVDWKNKTSEELLPYLGAYNNRLKKYEHFDALALKQQSIINYQDEFFLNNGQKLILDIFKVPIFDSNNNPSGLVTIAHDLTPRLKAEENKRILDEVVSYQKLRVKFFANISHELKTPLNLILSAIQFLQSVSNDDLSKVNFEKYSNVIKNNSYRMVRIVNNIIDITKIDDGYFEIHPENYNIVEVVEDICLFCSSYIHSKNLDFIFDTDVEEKIIACDPLLIERIILNLLSNAIKFTKPGGKITVNMYDRGDSIDISIKDTGIGIPKDKQQIIFERLIQVDKSFSRNHEGSGVGLSLVKAFVDLHKGSIKLHSEVGHGSEFLINLPALTLENKDIKVYSDTPSYEFKSEKINIEFSDIY